MVEIISEIAEKLYWKGGFHIFSALGCLGFGICIFLHRKFSYPIEKYKKLKLLKSYSTEFQLSSKDILPEADYIYYKSSCTHKDFQKIYDKLENYDLFTAKTIEKYRVNSIIILLLEFIYTDFDVTVGGSLDNVDKKRLMFGKIEYDNKSSLISFKGEVFIDRFDKQRVLNFINALEINSAPN